MGIFGWQKFFFDTEFRKEKEEEYKKLTLTNDFIFFRVMQNEELCKKLLEVILKAKIKKLKYHEAQKFFKKTYMSKGIKLDVYIEDDENTVYDVEMQARTDKNLPKRSRYYQGLIDVEKTRKATDYQKLKKSYIIFICPKDAFDKGKPIYTFENICIEDGHTRLEDGAVKIFLNASAYDKAEDEDIKAFLSYINDEIPTDEFTKELDEEVKLVRNSDIWRKSYMTLAMKYEEKFEDGRIVGRNEGIIEGKVEGREEDHKLSIEKLARHYMSENKDLTYEEAYKMAEKILK